METFFGPTQDGLQHFHANIRLAWKGLTVANTLAYYNTSESTAEKSFTVLATGN
jgi:hypothetical protein